MADRVAAARLVLAGRQVGQVPLALQVEADADGEIDSKVSVDCTVARVHQHGAIAARCQLKSMAHTGGSVE